MTAEKPAETIGHRVRVLDHVQMPRIGDDQSLGLREPCLDELSPFDESGDSVGAEHNQNRLSDPRCLLGPEAPLLDRGHSCRILARTQAIHAMIRGASDKEPFARDLGHRLLEERLLNQTERIRTYVAEELRAGLSIEEAGERYCVLASPDVYHPMTVELGWSAEYHQAWLTQLIRAELLGTNYWARTQTPTADGSSVPETTEAQSAASRSAST